VKIYIGDYTAGKNEEVQVSFSPDSIYKNNLKSCKKVYYAEYLNLSKTDLEFIFKNGSEDTILVFESESYFRKRSIKLPRRSDRVEIIYENKNDFSPFEFCKQVLTNHDRQFLFEFMCANKVALWLVIKILTSYSSELSEQNKKVIEALDMFYWKVHPEMLYAMMAFMMKTENRSYFKWRYPKKEEKDD